MRLAQFLKYTALQRNIRNEKDRRRHEGVDLHTAADTFIENSNPDSPSDSYIGVR